MTAQFHLWVKSLPIAAVLAFAASGTAGAATIQLRAWLNGAQEVPSVATSATGMATVTYNTVSGELSWNVTYSGLSSPINGAHFHGPMPAGFDANVTVPMSHGPSPIIGSATIDATQAAELLSGQWYINLHSESFIGGEIRGQVVVVRGDFDGDGKSDILWRNASTGENYLYPMDGTAIVLGEGYLRQVAAQSWQIAGIGDFNGDGKADILWRNSSTGENYVYLMNGTSIVGESYLRTVADQNWQVAGVGDFDGDGKADILWRNQVSGENYLYPMNGFAIQPEEGYLRTVADMSWKVAGIGDFDGDGKADILWRNRASGENYLYPMNGRAIQPGEGYLRTVADMNWQVAGIGDFDGDGKAGILWRNAASGESYIYEMNGRAIVAEGYSRTDSDMAWQIVAISDYDGDGKADILWRNVSTGENYLYPMDGTNIKPTEGSIRAVPDPNWRIAPIVITGVGVCDIGGASGGDPPAISGVSGSFMHETTVTITGSGFGSKPQAAPVVWDDASTGTLVTDGGKWDGYYPMFPDESTTYHLRYTTPIRGIALPHSHLSRYIAGGHGESGISGATVMFWRNRTMGAFPQYTYISWYQRADDNWVFGDDNNFKMYDFSTGDLPYGGAMNWYTAFEPPLPDNPSAPAKWALNDDCLGQACQSLAWPDNNGHGFFWDIGVNPFSGVWSKVEMEIKWTDQCNGYIKQWQDGVLLINYSGATDRYNGNARTESIGGYARMYGQPDNWRYWADVYLDYSPARVVLANDANLDNATIREVQIPSVWSDGSINVTVNLGKFTTGQTAYLFVFGPTGVPNAAGFPVTVE